MVVSFGRPKSLPRARLPRFPAREPLIDTIRSEKLNLAEEELAATEFEGLSVRPPFGALWSELSGRDSIDEVAFLL